MPRLTRNGTTNLSVLADTLEALGNNEILDPKVRDHLHQGAEIFAALSAPILTISTDKDFITAGHQETAEEKRLRDWLHRIQESSEPGTLVYAAAREALLGAKAPAGEGLKVGSFA